MIDLTWRRRDQTGSLARTRIFGEIPEGYAYKGLEIASRDQVLAQARETEMWQCFLDDWKNGYPMLRVQPSVSRQSA